MNILAAILALFFLVGVACAIHMYRFVQRSVRVPAKIVERLDATVANPETSSQTSPVSRYVVEVQDQGGRKRRVTLADAFGGSIADKFEADNGTIAVLYDPASPNVIRIDSPWALYFVPAFLCAPGLLFASLVAYVWIQT